jgi:hypothetical protein
MKIDRIPNEPIDSVLDKVEKVTAVETLCGNVMRRYGWELKLRFDKEGNPSAVSAMGTKKSVTNSDKLRSDINLYGGVVLGQKNILDLFNYWCSENKIPAELLFMGRRIFV